MKLDPSMAHVRFASFLVEKGKVNEASDFLQRYNEIQESKEEFND